MRACVRGDSAKTFSDHVIAFLMQRFESKEERVRIATLSIIKHVINTSGEYPCPPARFPRHLFCRRY